MPTLTRKFVPLLAVAAVACGGVAVLQLTRQRAAAVTADPRPQGGTAGALDFTAPQLVGPPQAQSTAPRAAPRRPVVVAVPAATFPQDYRILLTRSVFSNQPARRGSSEGGAGGAGSRSYESTLTFRGAMRDGSQFVAFIEDTGSNKTMRLKVGEKLGRGEIREISLNQIVYQVGDRATPIPIGSNLSGTGIMVASTQPSPASAGQAASASPSSSGGDDLLERMRKRRQQEGGS